MQATGLPLELELCEIVQLQDVCTSSRLPNEMIQLLAPAPLSNLIYLKVQVKLCSCEGPLGSADVCRGSLLPIVYIHLLTQSLRGPGDLQGLT